MIYFVFFRFAEVVDAVACRAEFVGFKRLVSRNRGENREENGIQRFHYYRPSELLTKLFGGAVGAANIITCASVYNYML